MQKKNSTALFFFYLLVAYVFLQFLSWAWLLIELNNEVIYLKKDLIVQKAGSPEEIVKSGEELAKKLHSKWMMVVGESTIFFFLLLLGFLKIRNSIKKEAAFAQQQKNFLLSVTHELKSPIASTRLQLETLQKRELDKAKQQEILANAIKDTDRLNSLVENILLAAKIETIDSNVKSEKINLSEVVKSILASETKLHSSTHIVKSHIQENLFLEIDSESVHSILSNLIENAVKYSEKESEIIVTLKQENNQIKLLVEDQGIGISDEEKENIFKKFYRIGNEETRSAKGTGLGLYIVKILVEKNKGTINVKNNSPKGSKFEVIFNNINS